MSQGGRTKIAELLQSTPAGSEVTAKGWVRTKRGNKNVAFIALNDGSIIHNIQIVVDVNKFDDELLKRITTGACIRVTGTLVESQGSGQRVEIQAGDIEVYGSADPDTYPLQKKGRRPIGVEVSNFSVEDTNSTLYCWNNSIMLAKSHYKKIVQFTQINL